MKQTLKKNGEINLLKFKTDKGSYVFVSAVEGGRGVFQTLDTIKDIKTGEYKQFERAIFRGVKAEQI